MMSGNEPVFIFYNRSSGDGLHPILYLGTIYAHILLYFLGSTQLLPALNPHRGEMRGTPPTNIHIIRFPLLLPLTPMTEQSF